MATYNNIELIKEGDAMCTDDQITLLDDSFDYLSHQLGGYCYPTEGPTCQLGIVLGNCTDELKAGDMSSCR